MGYRIELGEIETAVSSLEKIQSSVVIYDRKQDKIVLIYVGKISEEDIMKGISQKIPQYMYPQIFIKTRNLPYNQNGKIDRKWLNDHYLELKEKK